MSAADVHGTEEVPPDPGALIESMRAFGYSLPTAIADLIDNSITAGASTVDVEFTWDGAASTIAVSDDGRGMDERELVEAMRLGSCSPVEARARGDLGRFGLGLKSAGWSQARILSVITKAEGGAVHVRSWDLDHVAGVRRWSLLADPGEVEGEFVSRLGDRRSGTTVLLRHLDKLVGEPDTDSGRELFFAEVGRCERHLAMVFHRFLAGQRPLRLTVNGQRVVGWDPFLGTHAATQQLQDETLALAESQVVVTPFVLPHYSKLTADEHAAAAGSRGWNAQQGFYVYRERRLLVAGGWLGLRRMQQEEHYKLARIRIDLDNTLDLPWQIDVRKATASVPGVLRPDIERIATVTRRRAADAYRFRGKQLARSAKANDKLNFVWETRQLRGGARRFQVNRLHPVLKALEDEGPDVKRAVDRALKLAEENLPLEAIVMDMRENPDAERPRPFDDAESEVESMLDQAIARMVSTGITPMAALSALAPVEPFDAFPEIIEARKEQLG